MSAGFWNYFSVDFSYTSHLELQARSFAILNWSIVTTPYRNISPEPPSSIKQLSGISRQNICCENDSGFV